MKQYLLPIVLVAGSFASAQTKSDNLISGQHKYLYTNQIEYDNVQGGDDPTWDYEYVYDADNKRVKEIRHKKINPEGNASIVMGIIEVSYPSQNTIITQERTRDSENVWEVVTQVKYAYNDNGTIAQILQQEYNKDDKTFEDRKLYTFEYQNDKISNVLWQEYMEEENENGEMEKILNDLIEDQYKHNAEGKLVEHIRISREDNEPIERRKYSYDPQGQPAGYIWERYDENGNWIKYYEQKVVCEDGNAVEITEYDYNADGTRKRDAFLFLSSFDTTLQNDEVFKFKDVDGYIRLYENWFENKNAKADERNFSFDYHPIVNDWKAEKTFVNKYKKLENTLAVYDITKHQESVSIFPNPTTQYFSINTKSDKIKVEIYDLAGKLVKNFQNKQEQYNVSSLETGVYMVVIKGDNIQKSLKLIKK